MARNGTAARFLLTLGMLIGFGTVRAQDRTFKDAPQILRKTVRCLVTADYVAKDLKEIGLDSHSIAWARYHSGSIKGMTPTPEEMQVAIYSADGLSGWLLLAEKDQRGVILPVRNAYRLKRYGHHWQADEGNGRLATYEAMSAFSTQLSKYRRYQVKLEPDQGSCER